LVLFGLFWIAACLTVFTILYWRKQFQANRLNFSLQTSDFIDLAMDKLNKQKKVFRSIFPFLVIGLIVGLNLLYLDLLTDLSVGLRLIYHLCVSVIMVGLIPIGFKIRNWKFKKENQPVIDDLLNFKREIKE
jgi:tellurite resistance protein TehA-like permease